MAFGLWAIAMVLLGLGTALVYPTLLAAISDVAHPEWRASAVGVYRLWRDSGYAIGALLAGVLAGLFGVPWAIVRDRCADVPLRSGGEVRDVRNVAAQTIGAKANNVMGIWLPCMCEKQGEGVERT